MKRTQFLATTFVTGCSLIHRSLADESAILQVGPFHMGRTVSNYGALLRDGAKGIWAFGADDFLCHIYYDGRSILMLAFAQERLICLTAFSTLPFERFDRPQTLGAGISLDEPIRKRTALRIGEMNWLGAPLERFSDRGAPPRWTERNEPFSKLPAARYVLENQDSQFDFVYDHETASSWFFSAATKRL